MTCRGTFFIGMEPRRCDGVHIKLRYVMKTRRAGISGRVGARKSRVSPHRQNTGVITVVSHCAINLTELIAHHLFVATGKVAEVCYRN